MMNREMMEEIFWTVGEEHGTSTWYEIYDSDLFEEVCERIARVGEFTEWLNEMAGDL